METEAAHPLAMALVAPTAHPRIIQLSPIPGNIYNTDRFYYNPTAVDGLGNLGAVLAFASAHGHPAAFHECPDIHKFQGAYPSAIIQPISKVPPAIITQGLALLSGAASLAPPAVAQPPLVAAAAPLANDQQFVIHMAPSTSVDGATPSVGSNPLLSYKLLSCGGDPPSVVPSPLANL